MDVAEQFSTDRDSEHAAARPGAYMDEVLTVLRKLGAYVSERDVESMRRELERRIREHPAASIAVGFAAGVILGKLIQR